MCLNTSKYQTLRSDPASCVQLVSLTSHPVKNCELGGLYSGGRGVGQEVRILDLWLDLRPTLVEKSLLTNQTI